MLTPKDLILNCFRCLHQIRRQIRRRRNSTLSPYKSQRISSPSIKQAQLIPSGLARGSLLEGIFLNVTLAYYVIVGQTTLALDRSTVATAFQIDDFLRTGHNHLSLLKASTDGCVHYITTHLPLARPKQQATAAGSSREQRARSRSESVEPTSSITWPGDWGLDKATFRAALKKFDLATAELSELLKPSPDQSEEGPTSSQPSADQDVIMGDRNQDGRSNQNQHQRNQSQGNPPPNPPPVDPALLAAIQQIVQNSLQGIQGRRPDGGDGGGNDPDDNAAAAALANRDRKLRSEDLGYFDPDYESEKNEAIVSVGRHVYYRDMFI